MALLVPVIKSNYTLYAQAPPRGYPASPSRHGPPSRNANSPNASGITNCKSAPVIGSKLPNQHNQQPHQPQKGAGQQPNRYIFAPHDKELQKQLSNEYYRTYYNHKSSSSSSSLSEAGGGSSNVVIYQPNAPNKTLASVSGGAKRLRRIDKRGNLQAYAGPNTPTTIILNGAGGLKGGAPTSLVIAPSNNGAALRVVPASALARHRQLQLQQQQHLISSATNNKSSAILTTTLALPTLSSAHAAIPTTAIILTAPPTTGKRYRSLSERSRVITPMPIIFENETLGSGPEMLFHPHTAPPVRKTRVCLDPNKSSTDSSSSGKSNKSSRSKKNSPPSTNGSSSASEQPSRTKSFRLRLFSDSESWCRTAPRKWYSLFVSSSFSTTTTTTVASVSTEKSDSTSAPSLHDNIGKSKDAPTKSPPNIDENVSSSVCNSNQPPDTLLNTSKQLTDIKESSDQHPPVRLKKRRFLFSSSNTSSPPVPASSSILESSSLPQQSMHLSPETSLPSAASKSQSHTAKLIDPEGTPINSYQPFTTPSKPIDIVKRRKAVEFLQDSTTNLISSSPSDNEELSSVSPSPPNAAFIDQAPGLIGNDDENTKTRSMSYPNNHKGSTTLTASEIAMAGKYGFAQIYHNKSQQQKHAAKHAAFRGPAKSLTKTPFQSPNDSPKPLASPIIARSGLNQPPKNTAANHMSTLLKSLSERLSLSSATASSTSGYSTFGSLRRKKMDQEGAVPSPTSPSNTDDGSCTPPHTSSTTPRSSQGSVKTLLTTSPSSSSDDNDDEVARGVATVHSSPATTHSSFDEEINEITLTRNNVVVAAATATCCIEPKDPSTIVSTTADNALHLQTKELLSNELSSVSPIDSSLPANTSAIMSTEPPANSTILNLQRLFDEPSNNGSPKLMENTTLCPPIIQITHADGDCSRSSSSSPPRSTLSLSSSGSSYKSLLSSSASPCSSTQNVGGSRRKNENTSSFEVTDSTSPLLSTRSLPTTSGTPGSPTCLSAPPSKNSDKTTISKSAEPTSPSATIGTFSATSLKLSKFPFFKRFRTISR